ncbi:hypothetical protein IQE94_06840 [Synechocystis sp. PCC 7339]|uniref:hypothetical protein n=1 Tax=unclassified Synechocystis TaxID=2640012 RepID=UPI001BB09484|nr:MULTISPECIES: hypothetical protein [unclassified Synechocystis]QUS61775.1 hypothetical protein HTZ78_14625 [Synechocystis sp. PCC 7338]UAJ73972.1 hypothetical protein IQE94_06840 [Synechocystis sp. PCC 7339]
MRIFAPHPLWQTLVFTAGIMLAAGMGFGMALRSAAPGVVADPTVPTEPQDSGGIFRSEQSFPPQPDWNLDSQGEDENHGGARYNSLQMQP